jgi:broad specificity phosphatase PhoE
VSRLLLVRHGQSTWNADGRWQGRADPPLSELGQRQARAVAAALGPGGDHDYEIGAAWSSPLQRAQQTAVIVGATLALEPVVDERLEERDAGEWTGLTRFEIEEAWPGYLDEHRRPPGFEHDEPLLVRALAALQEMAAALPVPAAAGSASGAATGLVVTHAGVIRAVERHLGGRSDPVPNLGGRELVAGAGGIELGARLLLLDPAAVEVTTPNQI